MKAILLATTIFAAAATNAVAYDSNQNCTSGVYKMQLEATRDFFAGFRPHVLEEAQEAMRTAYQMQGIKVDGTWGPKTSRGICSMLQFYKIDTKKSFNGGAIASEFFDWLSERARNTVAGSTDEAAD